MCLQIIFNIDMYREGLTLNNLQRLICHKSKANQIKPNMYNQSETGWNSHEGVTVLSKAAKL